MSEARAVGPRVVGLGGGHGLAATLAAARTYAGAITAIVSVADDGGSSGRLRRDFGIPAVGDIRRCLIALGADEQTPWLEAFGARFERGDLAGHALGNLVIAGLVHTLGDLESAVAEAGRLLGVDADVLPATVEEVVLVAEVAGRRLVGQTAVEAAEEPITRVALEPLTARAPKRALDAIADADQVVLGPGSLYTSVLAVTAVRGIRDALAARRRGVVYVCNLKASRESYGYDAARHVAALAAHGVDPDVILADPDAIALGDLAGDPRFVPATLAKPDGWSHDPDRLAAALARLAEG